MDKQDTIQSNSNGVNDTNEPGVIQIVSSTNSDDSVEVVDRSLPEANCPVKATVINPNPALAVTPFRSSYNIGSQLTTAQEKRQQYIDACTFNSYHWWKDMENADKSKLTDNAAMDTNDSEEINVETSPKGDESIEVIDRSTPEPKRSVKNEITSPIRTMYQSTAEERRQQFHTFHRVINDDNILRQKSEPIIHPHRINPHIPKQQSEPGPLGRDRHQLDGPDGKYYIVTCGSLQGKLILSKFTCPGINVKCIELSGHPELITPKELVCHAGKQTLKDWKRAIRINQKMLRKLMDDNELDYYCHETKCSNTCKSNKTQSGIDSTGSSISRDSSMGSMNPSSFDESHRMPSQHSFEQQTPSSFDRSSSEDSGDIDVPLAIEANEETVISCHNFWSGIKNNEIMDEIVREVIEQISSLHQRSQHSLRQEDAVILTNIVNSLDMMPMVKARLAGRKHYINQRSKDLNETVVELQNKLLQAKREQDQISERKRQIDATLAKAPPEKNIGRKKPRITQVPRQHAIESGPRSVIAPPFQPHPIYWQHSHYVVGPRIYNTHIQTPSLPASPSPLSRTDETQIAQIGVKLRNGLVIQSSPEHSASSSSPMPPK